MATRTVRYPSLLDALWPGTNAARDTLLVLGGSLVIALSAQIAIPLPFTPVPITAQTLAVGLIGALLGARRGALTVALYLAEGAIGFPVFALGTGGIARFMGPSAGYLAGFLAQAFVVGRLCEMGWGRRFSTAAGALILGDLTVHLYGLVWLSSFDGFQTALKLGFFPFIPGDVIKILIGSSLLPGGWRAIRWLGLSPREY